MNDLQSIFCARMLDVQLFCINSVYARGLKSLIIRDWRFLAPATNNQLDFILRFPERRAGIRHGRRQSRPFGSEAILLLVRS